MTDRDATHLDALAATIRRLRSIVEPLDEAAIGQPAYPREWTIAQVMSHLGSAAVIMQRRFEAALAGAAVLDEFAPSAWDEWNAKSPRAQVDDALAADAALAAALETLSDEEREGFSSRPVPYVSASRARWPPA
ncbi:MAG: maleylpyruvate isomerase N-terminal domain-containing protein [Actinomycetota bacterium]|nr:maleylpyruvate isomerase N-terminal domain-containing protein [Actinomycetota bacterium]